VTRRSYGDLKTWACCWQSGELIFDGFRFTRVGFMSEKFTCHENCLQGSYNPGGLILQIIQLIQHFSLTMTTNIVEK
jgi:hypothetical protein